MNALGRINAAIAEAKASIDEFGPELTLVKTSDLSKLLAVVEAAQDLVSKHQYTTPADTTNCRYCDNNMDHEGTYEDMHAPTCEIKAARLALAALTEDTP